MSKDTLIVECDECGNPYDAYIFDEACPFCYARKTFEAGWDCCPTCGHDGTDSWMMGADE